MSGSREVALETTNGSKRPDFRHLAALLTEAKTRLCHPCGAESNILMTYIILVDCAGLIESRVTVDPHHRLVKVFG